MRIVAKHWLGRHHGGDTTALALVVALPALQNRFAERTGPGELDDTVRNGRAGVEQHAGDVVMAPRYRDLERIFGAREAPGARAQGSDDVHVSVRRRVPE